MIPAARDRQASSSVFSTRNSAGTYPALVVCEHASNHVPESFDGLGLPDEVAVSHIAWDPGAREVAEKIADRLDAPCLLGEVSRLVYDCNRPPDAPDAIPEKSEIYTIPGNEGLSSQERARRVAGYYMPFKQAIAAQVQDMPAHGALITVHSFTPVYLGEQRSVELGILHDSDSRLADAMLAVLPRYCSLDIRRNEPYGPQDGVTHTLRHHALASGLLNVMIEIRNDLLRTDEQRSAMADTLAKALKASIGQCLPGDLIQEVAQ